MSFAYNIRQCHRCKEHSQTQRGGCWGSCPCHYDGIDIIAHAKTGDCPLGKFLQLGPSPKSPGTMIPPPPPPTPPSGPGTELHKLLGKIGIHITPTCGCRAHMAKMDTLGTEWCLEHIEEISGWMAEEAKGRKLPYVAAAGKLLIRRAIKNARHAK